MSRARSLTPAIPATLLMPGRTLSGQGLARSICELCSEYGLRGVLVHGRSLEKSGMLSDIVNRAPKSLTVTTWQHPGGEPNLTHVEDCLAELRDRRPDWVAAIGGGSVMDLTKAAAGLLEAPLPVEAYHDGASIPPSPTPFCAVPTTAGTGSEATTVSVLTNTRTNTKKSIRHTSFMPHLVVLDPAVLEHCPATVLAHSGMDALTQAIESFISTHAVAVTEDWSLLAVRRIGPALVPAFRGARGSMTEDLMAGSYLAGLALANARLGLVHGLAHPLGVRYGMPHGLACAVTLPSVLAFNRASCETKYERLSTALGGDAITVVKGLLRELNITSPLSGQSLYDKAEIIKETLASGSTAANPRKANEDDIGSLLDSLFRSSG